MPRASAPRLALSDRRRPRGGWAGPGARGAGAHDAAADGGISEDGERLARSGALIEITFVSKNAEDEIVVSKEIYDLPAVDT